jgi:ORF6N domain
VGTGVLNRAVKRNRDKFPEDFMFQLDAGEWELLRCQIGISNKHAGSGLRFQFGTSKELASTKTAGLRFQNESLKSRRGGRRYLPYAFTEQGVAMLSGVLRSQRAVQVNIAIKRTFVRLREMLLSNADLARKLNALEKKYDAKFKVVFDAIRELMTPPEPQRRQIGFHSHE